MFEFKGIDLSTKYITPQTDHWLAEQENNPDAPIEGVMYDSGCGWLIWTYSADEDGRNLPKDLAEIVKAAYEHEWRFIVIDADGADCELFDDYVEEWEKYEA